MKKIGFIPIRKGSKGIPGKNTRKMLGRPLYAWVLGEAILSQLDEVCVFTDDEEVVSAIEREYGWTAKVTARLRSAENATDTASTESALAEFLSGHENPNDIICLLQATSPLTAAADIDKVLEKVVSGHADSALSVVRTHRFLWSEEGAPLNYDYMKRPRRQDFAGTPVENGAVYATNGSTYAKTRNRLGGKVAVVEMPEETLIEIDHETDWQVCETLLAARLSGKSAAHGPIRYLVLDVDGVFTDAGVYYNEEGEFGKRFDMRDGMGLEILRQHGVGVMVITSEQSPLVAARMRKLGIQDAYLGVKDKFSRLTEILGGKNIDFSSIAYIGDDVNDLACICAAGWGLAPADATVAVQRHADIVMRHSGGHGAIREACEFIIKHNKRHDSV